MPEQTSVRLREDVEKFVESLVSNDATKTDVINALLAKMKENMEKGIESKAELDLPLSTIDLDIEAYKMCLEAISLKGLCPKLKVEMPRFRMPCFQPFLSKEVPHEIQCDCKEKCVIKDGVFTNEAGETISKKEAYWVAFYIASATVFQRFHEW